MLPMLLLAVHAALPQVTPVRVADASCGQCHRQIYESYVQTPMANASGLAAERLMTGSFEHRGSGVEYTVRNAAGTPVLSWRDLRDTTRGGAWTLSYFLGSGHLGVTWLYSVDKYLFESPVAWYAASGSLDMKPGLEDARMQPPSLPMQSECMRCHMSGVQPTDAGTLNRYSGVPFLHGGITCEACHGDTRQHVESRGRAGVVNPAKLEPELRDSVCISCHLEGDVSVERAGHRALDYRPGEPVSDYLAYYVYAKSDATARGVSEVEQFSQSHCKRASGDRMSCTSCHDPHYTPEQSERAAFFRGKCLACHSGAAFAKTHHPENPDCTSCHMRHNGAENIPHVAWTDHRILRVPDEGSAAGASATDVLTPIFSPGATKRDLGMAYYVALMKGDRAAEAKAWPLLDSERSSIANDKAALNALGVLSAERGDYQQAEWCFRSALKVDGTDLTALSNLGILLAKQGKLTEAAGLLREAFERNQDVAGLAMNLARVECGMGDGSAARAVMESAARYNPGVAEIREFAQRTAECRVGGGQAQ